MRKYFLSSIALAALVAIVFPGCKKDNFEQPTANLSGRVVYQSQPVGLRSNGVQLEIWQSGFQLFTKIPVHLAQDGTFSAALFDGDYKITRLKGNGPWADNTDTINVKVSGATTVDVPVDPYFIIKSETFAKSGTNITATFSLQKVNTTKNLELVRLFIGQTLITDQNNNGAISEKVASAIPDATQPVTLTAAIPTLLAGKDYVYARVAVKTVGVAELLYSLPQKIALK